MRNFIEHELKLFQKVHEYQILNYASLFSDDDLPSHTHKKHIIPYLYTVGILCMINNISINKSAF